MKSLSVIVLVTILATVAHCKKVKVSIFYETECPGCQQEIVRNLVPARKAIGEYMDIEFVPWGNAKLYHGHIICQHGQKECDGNAIHACVLDMFDFETAFQFIVCTFSSKDNMDPPKAAGECFEKLNLDSDKIKSCAYSDRGHDLSLKMHEKTPQIRGVPWTLVDGKGPVFDDLQKYICQNYLKDENVPACEGY